MSILNSLAVTESGGNFAAQNNETGSSGRNGHFGRLQFGRDRFDDAVRAGVIPQGMTIEQFGQDTPQSRQVQERTEAWHQQDLMRQAESLGLTQYIGQQVGGIPITMDAIVAMGHLGGMGGARDFLRSGGQSNPSDSFGTSLADYARQHGGAGQQAQGAPQPQNAMQPQAQPQDQQRNQMAVMRQYMPQTNALNAADFQNNTRAQPLMGFGAGQNPFQRG